MNQTVFMCLFISEGLSGQTTIYKTLRRKLKIEQHEPQEKPGVNPGGPER
jgi:hypothetical protein